jgi:hypothetical protein
MMQSSNTIKLHNLSLEAASAAFVANWVSP